MKKHFLIIVIIALIVNACKKEDEIVLLTKERLSGLCQKGPFINGSSVTLFGLNEKFSQTGRSYEVQTKDNLGAFELNDIQISSNFVKLKAEGYYFNEISGEQSTGPITLYSCTDLSENSNVNINLLSTLEVARVKYLINKGYSYSVAKSQAQQEILNIFFLNCKNMDCSESLDISVNKDENAILLAISIILQGFRTEAELIQLLADISSDIESDGQLNNENLGSELINDVRFLDLKDIRDNIEKRYSSLGVANSIPNFETYVSLFIESCTYPVTNNISYPDNGKYGTNILNLKDTLFHRGSYSFCADLPNGTHLKTVFSSGTQPIWGFDIASVDGWTHNGYNCYNESNRVGRIEMNVLLVPGTDTLFIYENHFSTVSRKKIIHVVN